MLIRIAPHGAITFISSLYTSLISDKEITRCSGILDFLEAHDSVMADKGFDIEDPLRSKQTGKLDFQPRMFCKYTDIKIL